MSGSPLLMFRPLQIVSILAALSASLPAAEKVKFNRDIRPIMSDTCFHCHGPDKNSRKGGLRLDIREEALKPGKSGEIPIVPGKPEASEIIKRIFTGDESDLMPPDEAHKTLTPAQKETFKRWVAEGAVYEAHWAYTPLVRPPVPVVGGTAQPIDAFIIEKLKEMNSQLSAEAGKRTLLRRLSLDLTGLPPTVAELDVFLKDNSERAYETQVERLLNSPHYGERMAVWWLDVARFADTVGYHGDQNQRIFPYRDYVIDAFNTNKRFDQFTIEQLAGDLLPNPTTTQLIATGFNRLNMVTREGGAQAKEYIAKYGAERVRTVGGAWMGATLGCSECHDHKFDPFTAKDFYAMQAFFADVKQWGVYSFYSSSPIEELRGVNNEYPFYPEIEVESDYLKRHAALLRTEMSRISDDAAEVLEKDPAAKTAFAAWQQESSAFLKTNPTGWVTPAVKVTVAEASQAKKDDIRKSKKAKAALSTAKPNGDLQAASKDEAKNGPDGQEKPKPAEPTPLKSFVVEADGTIRFKAKAADNTKVNLKPAAGWVSALKVELLPDPARKGMILRSGAPGSATLKVSAAVIRAGSPKPAAQPFRHGDANLKAPRYSSSFEVVGVKDSWKTVDASSDKPHTAIFTLLKPLKLAEGDSLEVTIADNAAAAVRVSVSPFAFANLQDQSQWSSTAGLLGSGANAPSQLRETYLLSTGWNEPVLTAFSTVYSKWLQCRDGKTYTMITQPVAPLTVKVLPRGDWMNETGEVVTPASPEFLPTSFKPKDGSRLTRMDLARWLCAPENPLTPRAVVNRWWKQCFGTGLSSIVDDLGAQGEPPSHPELLDWLAAEFRESGWDVKHMMRLLVMSKTYRQSSSLRPEMRDIDPSNRLLSSQNPRRLDAEFVRDNALSIAGLLNLDMGGPSVKPYQPADYYENIQFPSRNYVTEVDDQQWRRGVYMHWQRTFLHPMLANFDAPMRDECTANRPLSNTPQQALTLLNDPSFVEAARVFASKLLQEKADSDEARLGAAFEQALARPVKDKERESLLYLLRAQREYYQANGADAAKVIKIGLAPQPANIDPAELASWTMVCRVILNLQETITRY